MPKSTGKQEMAFLSQDFFVFRGKISTSFISNFILLLVNTYKDSSGYTNIRYYEAKRSRYSDTYIDN